MAGDDKKVKDGGGKKNKTGSNKAFNSSGVNASTLKDPMIASSSSNVDMDILEEGTSSKGDYVSFNEVNATYYDPGSTRCVSEAGEPSSPTRTERTRSTYEMESKWPYAKKNVRSHAANRIDRFRRNLTRSLCGLIWVAFPLVGTTILLHLKVTTEKKLSWFLVFAPFWLVLFPLLIILCNLMNYFRVGNGSRRVQGGCSSFPIIMLIVMSVLLCLKLDDKINVPYQVVFLPLYTYLLGLMLYCMKVVLEAKRRTLLGDIGAVMFVFLLLSAVILTALKLDHIIDVPSYRATTLFIVLTAKGTILGVVAYGVYKWAMIDVAQWSQYPCQWKTPFNVCSVTMLCLFAVVPTYMFLDGVVNLITGESAPTYKYLFNTVYVLEAIMVIGIFCTDYWDLGWKGILKAYLFKDIAAVLRTETESAV